MTETINLNDKDTREKLAIQYQPLVHKISNQWKGRLPLEYRDIVGYAEEGLVMAFNSYDPDKIGKDGNKTKQSFRQYAAWCILHAILNGANNEGHTVKFSSYLQNKRKKEGSSCFIMKSLDCSVVDDDGNLKMDIPDEQSIDINNMLLEESDVMKSLFKRVEEKFCKRDCDIFYSSLGLKGKDMAMGKDLAKKYHIAPCTVTFTVKKVVKYIRKDEELWDALWEVLNK